MRALIDPRENRVAQLVEDENEFAVAAPLFWTDAPAGVTTQWTYQDGEFLPPPEPPQEEIDRARFRKLRERILTDIAAGDIPDAALRTELQALRTKIGR